MFHMPERSKSVEDFIASLTQREYPHLLTTDLYPKERALEGIRTRNPVYRDYVRRNLAQYITKSFELANYESLHSLELVLVLEEVSGLKFPTTAIFKENSKYTHRTGNPLFESIPSRHYPDVLHLYVRR